MPVAIPRHMKCSSLSLSGREREKFVNPRKAKTSMTMKVNTINHYQIPVQRPTDDEILRVSYRS